MEGTGIWTLAVVSTPICAVATLLNVVLIFSLCQPAEGLGIRQPLHFLFIVVLGNSTSHQLLVLVYAVLGFLWAPFWLLVVTLAMIYQTYCFSFSTCAWISVVYYLKIVPQRHGIFIWIKKNIKVIVFLGFVFDQVLLLASVTLHSVALLVLPADDTTNVNGTTRTGLINNINNTFLQLSVQIYCAYFIFPVLTLTLSWGRTFYYLHGHIKSMKQTSSSSSKHQKNQMRVTIMGMVQTAVFIPSSLWAITTAILTSQGKSTDESKRITITITCICGLANIICLGASQSVFRVQLISLLKRFTRAFKPVQV